MNDNEKLELEAANIQVKQWLEEAKAMAPSIFTKTDEAGNKLYPFNNDLFDRFTVSVIPDEDNLNHHKNHVFDYLLHFSYFKRYIRGPRNVLFMLAHSIAHDIMLDFWRQVSIRRDAFAYPTIHLIEDMYSQYLLSQFGVEDEMLEMVMSMKFTKNYQEPELRAKVYSMISKECDQTLPMKMRALHFCLHNNKPNANDVDTFKSFLHYWVSAYHDHDVRDLLDRFEVVKPDKE